MRVFLTVLGDSIRLLRARALFWVAIGISVLIAVIYMSIGFNEKGLGMLPRLNGSVDLATHSP